MQNNVNVNRNNFQTQEIVSFIYVDEKGVESERTITVDKVFDRHVVGLCHDRQAYRSFNYSRITMN